MHTFLNKSASIVVVAIFLVTSLGAQSTERFVRIIGNASHTYQSDETRVYFAVNEVVPNEYKKISYKSLETAYAEFVQELSELGIAEGDIVQSNSELTRFTKTKTRNYHIDVDSQEVMDGLSSLGNPGFKVKLVKFLFTDVDEDVETSLSLQAIQDARRKARKICSELDMKLGKILNIEDKSSGCCSAIPESKSPEVTNKYNVTITFELLDK